MQLRPDGLPRRNDLTLLQPVERAIWDAKQAVEAGPAHPLMTDATILLSQAQNKVADFIEGIVPPSTPADVIKLDLSAVDDLSMVRCLAEDLARSIKRLGTSRELSLAITKLQEASMWINEHHRVA